MNTGPEAHLIQVNIVRNNIIGQMPNQRHVDYSGSSPFVKSLSLEFLTIQLLYTHMPKRYTSQHFSFNTCTFHPSMLYPIFTPYAIIKIIYKDIIWWKMWISRQKENAIFGLFWKHCSKWSIRSLWANAPFLTMCSIVIYYRGIKRRFYGVNG